MRRSRFIYWGLLVSIGIASGCGTTGGPVAKSWLRGKSDKSGKEEKRVVADNPFRRVGDIDAKTEDESTDKRVVKHDAATRQLIETELADASPEERKNLTTDFRTLDSLVVKQILKLRRLRIELEQQQKQAVANGGERQANEPYRGLGAAFPGAGDMGSQTRYRPNSDNIRPVAATQDDLNAGSTASGFGHSLTYAKGADIPVVTPRGPQAVSVSEGLNPNKPFQDLPGATPRAQLEERPTQPAVTAAYTDSPGRGPSTIPANGQLNRQSLQRDLPNGQSPHGQQPATNSSGATRNPLQFAGIDTSPGRRPGETGMLNSQVGDIPASTQWSDSLQRLIVVAEEQAYAAQAAWEQADQLGPADNIDEPTRRKMLEARRQDFVEKQVDLRMLYLMSGQQARALERVRGLERADQEFWTQVMWSLANYFDREGIPNGDDRATQTVTQLRAAIQHLQETAKLEIRNVDFCTKISSFGNYEPFANNVFRAGQPVMVYAEIENFTSDRGSDGVYRTQLKSSIEIHRVTPQGSEVIDTIDFDATTDLCRNHRRDYYHSYELQIPDKATSGSYALVLVVEDQFSKRVATYSRNFTVE